MEYVLLALAYLFVPMTLCVIDRRIKGTRSVLTKIVSVITVMAFLYLAVYFYGQQILSTFRINAKSFTSAKAFFSSRILVLLGLMILYLFIVCKFVFITLVFQNIKKTVTNTEKVIALIAVFFDLMLVPNILVNSSLFAVLTTLTLVEIGLVYVKLVFSITSKKSKEVLAWLNIFLL